MQELEYYLPVVDPADIKRFGRNRQTNRRAECLWRCLAKAMLRSGADVFAVCRRGAIIWVLGKLPRQVCLLSICMTVSPMTLCSR